MKVYHLYCKYCKREIPTDWYGAPRGGDNYGGICVNCKTDVPYKKLDEIIELLRRNLNK